MAAPPPGCQVQAHDPTVASVRSTAGGNLMVTRKGVAAENSRNFKTLDTFVRVNNHTDYVIDYLKVIVCPKLNYNLALSLRPTKNGKVHSILQLDIEGAEIKVMKEWIKR